MGASENDTGESDYSDVSENGEYFAGWRMALLLLGFATVTLVLEKSLKLIEKLVSGQKGLIIALQHLKNELLFVGTISLLLSAFQNLLAEICIPIAHGGPYAVRRLLSEESGGRFCPEGKESLWPIHMQHLTHIFIFVVALTHILYGAITVYLTLIRVKAWRKWEVEAIEQAKRGDCHVMKMPVKWLYHNMGSNWVFHWAIMIVRQYHLSINQTLYHNARLMFIEKMGLPYDFDYHRIVVTALEQELMHTLHPEWHLWLIAVVWFAIPPPSYISFWMYGISLSTTLIIGGKLVDVLVRISCQVALKYGDSVVYGRMGNNPLAARRGFQSLGRLSLRALGTANPDMQRRFLGADAAADRVAGEPGDGGHLLGRATAAPGGGGRAGGMGGVEPATGGGLLAAEGFVAHLASRSVALSVLRSWASSFNMGGSGAQALPATDAAAAPAAAAKAAGEATGSGSGAIGLPGRSSGCGAASGGEAGVSGSGNGNNPPLPRIRTVRGLSRGSAPATVRRQVGVAFGEERTSGAAGTVQRGRAPRARSGRHLAVIEEGTLPQEGPRRRAVSFFSGEGEDPQQPPQLKMVGSQRHRHRHHHHHHHHGRSQEGPRPHQHPHSQQLPQQQQYQQQQEPPSAPMSHTQPSFKRTGSGRAGHMVAVAKRSIFALLQRNPAHHPGTQALQGSGHVPLPAAQPQPQPQPSRAAATNDGGAGGSSALPHELVDGAAGADESGPLHSGALVSPRGGAIAGGSGSGGAEALASESPVETAAAAAAAAADGTMIGDGGAAGANRNAAFAHVRLVSQHVNDYGDEDRTSPKGPEGAGTQPAGVQQSNTGGSLQSQSSSSYSSYSSYSRSSTDGADGVEAEVGGAAGKANGRGHSTKSKRFRAAFKIMRTRSGRLRVPLLLRPCYCVAYKETPAEYVKKKLRRREARGMQTQDAKHFFWFGKPRFLTALFTLAYFQNSLSIAICILSLAGQVGPKMGTWSGISQWGIIIQLCLDLVLVPKVALCVLPLYALIQPLGSHCPTGLLEEALEEAHRSRVVKPGHGHAVQHTWFTPLGGQKLPGTHGSGSSQPGLWSRVKGAFSPQDAGSPKSPASLTSPAGGSRGEHAGSETGPGEGPGPGAGLSILNRVGPSVASFKTGNGSFRTGGLASAGSMGRATSIRQEGSGVGRPPASSARSLPRTASTPPIPPPSSLELRSRSQAARSGSSRSPSGGIMEPEIQPASPQPAVGDMGSRSGHVAVTMLPSPSGASALGQGGAALPDSAAGSGARGSGLLRNVLGDWGRKSTASPDRQGSNGGQPPAQAGP